MNVKKIIALLLALVLVGSMAACGTKPAGDKDSSDGMPQTEEEKKAAQEKAEAGKPVLEAVKEALGDQVKEVRISSILKSGACCLTADGPVSLEMEKYMRKVDGDRAARAQRVLELNPDSGAFAALRAALDSDKELAGTYAEILYDQALLIEGMPIEDPVAFSNAICDLMAQQNG